MTIIPLFIYPVNNLLKLLTILSLIYILFPLAFTPRELLRKILYGYPLLLEFYLHLLTGDLKRYKLEDRLTLYGALFVNITGLILGLITLVIWSLTK